MSLTPINTDLVHVERVLRLVCADLIDKLCRDNMRFQRQANTFALHLRNVDSTETSKSVNMGKITQHGSDADNLLKSMVSTAMILFQDIQGKSNWLLRWICVSATKFEQISNTSILKFFASSPEKSAQHLSANDNTLTSANSTTPVIQSASVMLKSIPSPNNQPATVKRKVQATLDNFITKKARTEETNN